MQNGRKSIATKGTQTTHKHNARMQPTTKQKRVLVLRLLQNKKPGVGYWVLCFEAESPTGKCNAADTPQPQPQSPKSKVPKSKNNIKL